MVNAGVRGLAEVVIRETIGQNRNITGTAIELVCTFGTFIDRSAYRNTF